MAQRKTALAPGEFFHVYNRGNSKQKIFLNDKDRERFVKLLHLSNSTLKRGFNFRDDIIRKKSNAWDFEVGTRLVSIGAWVLMPNHFHLYVTCPTPGVGQEEGFDQRENITCFMHKLCMSYAKYFNKKYNRSGGLFEGRFKSTHVENDAQAKYLFSYIHLNPVKLIDSKWKEEGIKNPKLAIEYLNTYKWSSYLDHRGVIRNENKILHLDHFPKYFLNLKNIDEEIMGWLKYGPYPTPGVGQSYAPKD